MNNSLFVIERARAEDAAALLDYLKIVGGETENLSFGAEGVPLSLDGKANRLGALVRANLSMAMQGLAVIPMLAGWDHERREGRIFGYDATGGRYEESGFHAIGSGAAFARGSLKKTHNPASAAGEAIAAVIRSLYDAADDDAATGGPDLARRIFPVVMTATESGVQQLPVAEVAELTTRVLETM